MSERDENQAYAAGSVTNIFDSHEVESVLSGAFYTPEIQENVSAKKVNQTPQEKPNHYKVICISMYTKDLEHMDGLVEELKARGMTKASRSALIRVALDQLDLDKVPKGL